MSTYLITGGAGFIGSNIGLHLAGAGHTVRVLDNFSSVSRAQFEASLDCLHDRFQIIEGDVRDLPDCRRACIGAPYILHLAGLSSVQLSLEKPQDFIDVNVGGTVNMLTASRDLGFVERFIQGSTCAVYGESPTTTRHECTILNPTSPLGSAALAAENLCQNFHQSFGFPSLSLRYFNIYGPGENPTRPAASVISRFAAAFVEGTRPVIYGDGQQTRDFLHVADAVDATICAFTAKRDANGQVFNIGTSDRYTMNVIVEMLAKITGRALEPIFKPELQGDIKHSRADITKAAGVLLFSPSVRLADGLRHLVSVTSARLLAA